MSKRYRITPRAFKDLTAIARYTTEHWGVEQRDSYLKKFEQCFEWLTENPRLGRERTEIAAGYRSYPQGAHLVFYIDCGDAIDIIGVPHQSMDIETYFEDA